jgi:N-acyl homoserine lactone hydrolase
MKIYALKIGATKVPYGQFYGGTEGWVGLRGMWRFLRDKRHFILVPIHVYLIDHPQAGLILVDAGINWDQAHAHHDYYRGRLARMSLDEDEYLLGQDEELSAQLGRLGYRCSDISTVIVTHLHEDHIGGLLSVRHAKVVLAAPEWTRVGSWNRMARFLPFLAMEKFSPSIAGMAPPQVVAFSSGAFCGFARSQDLLGDGSVVLLPTPGHTSGHLAVLVRLDGYQVLCCGDTIYTLRHLAIDQVRPVAVSRKSWAQQADSIRRIQRLRAALPDTVIAPAHDHTRYSSAFLEPFLADGGLSVDERDAVRAYERRLFTREWELAPEALPRFAPPSDRQPVGGVTEP